MYLTVLAIFLWLVKSNNFWSWVLVVLDFAWEIIKYIQECNAGRICVQLDRIEKILRELEAKR